MAAPGTGPDEEDQDLEGDHDWHFRYNRRLSCFSQAVSCITFSMDGQYLVSGTGSGDVKVWDTGCWAEAAKLKGCRREEPRALVISSAQRWLVAAYGSVLHIFQCTPPWRLEQALPAIVDPTTKESSEWSCIAFSPMAEVDHPGGHTGEDNHLAAFSTSYLCVLDYSGGWGQDTPRRTRSLMQSARPTSLAYTACGWWMICGFEGGQLQIWNAFSLTLEKTLSAHTASVNSLSASPRAAPYGSRVVSCGADQALRVWHSSGWLLEQHLHDTRCDRAGVRRCTFSCTGNWLVSFASELSVWRVCITRRNRMILQLHQRLAAMGGAEGLRAAAFCSNNDAIAVGSRDGVLGLWTKYAGTPPDLIDAGAAASSMSKGTASSGRSEPWGTTGTLPRPMQRITPQGVKPLPKPGQPRGEWFQRTHQRTMSMTPLGARSRMGSLSAAGARLSTPLELSVGSRAGTPTEDVAGERSMARQNTMPEFRWRATGFEMDDVFSSKLASDKLALPSVLDKRGASPEVSAPRPSQHPGVSPVRKNMLHACRGLVQRISLDPKVITDDPEGNG
ncbi:unnamed protein product [Polarella glacialis]|uniref:Uncharacterized protein n=1 Tax=Polarella glacialis TaxID=89957 RepID=A0A813KYR8_POLGL|nr:unnamed protein product [Polarella glacialis]